MFISLVSIYSMPERMMGSNGVYVLTSTRDKNPIRSNLDVRIAYGLENMSYIEAVSPEIFVFTVIRDQPVTARGVMFDKFLKLENGKIVEGELPERYDGAIVGYNFARKFNVHVGESFTLYGSFTSSIAIVNVTGVYRTGGPADDEILISLPTARKLAGIAAGKVSIIRVRSWDVDKVNRLLSGNYPKFTVDVNSTHQVYLGEVFNATAMVRNMGTEPGRANLTVEFQGQKRSANLTVESASNVSFAFKALRVGRYNLTAVVYNNIFYYTCYTQIVVMRKPVFIQGPSMAYVDTPTTYRIRTVGNKSVESGVLEVIGPKNHTRRYNVSGQVSVEFPHMGNYTLVFHGDIYENASMNVSVYGRAPFSALAKMDPPDINGTIYAVPGKTVRVITGGKVLISLDGGSPVETNKIRIPGEMSGNHLLNITVVMGTLMGEGSFLLHIIGNYSPAIISPVDNSSSVVYGENVTFQLVDPIPIMRTRYVMNDIEEEIWINQSFDADVVNYTYNITLRVNQTEFNLTLEFWDYWNRSARIAVHCPIIYYEDVFPPKIYAKDVKLWGGNSTVVSVEDNQMVKNISVYFYGHYFNATVNARSGEVRINTMFRSGNTVEFVPPGRYNATVRAWDTSGNLNVTNFTITVDNRGEMNPPIIIGPGYADISSSYVSFHAFDNVGILRISCYEGATLIKETSGSVLNITSSDLTNGSHKLIIEALDVNFNYGYFTTVLVKNYTDTTPPEIIPGPLKIWGGNSTVVRATDDVKVSRISVHVFGMYFNGTSAAKIKTKFTENGTVEFIAPGEYTMEVRAWDISGNVNTSLFILRINNTGEKNPPEFAMGDYVEVNASENITVRAFDNVGIASMQAYLRGVEIAQSHGDYLNVSAMALPCGYSEVEVRAVDLNGNFATMNITVQVLDDIPPELVFNETTVWGGNSTEILAEDNVRVAMMRTSIMGHVFESKNSTLLINTAFREEGRVYYLPERVYQLNVLLVDASGNGVVRTFRLVVNNTGERIPPVIFGPTYASINITSNVEYRAVDNVAVERMWIVHDGVIIANGTGSEVVLRYSALPAGLNNITVFAEDTNGNVAAMNSTVYVASVKTVTIEAHLQRGEITTKDRGMVIVSLQNDNTPGYYNVSISLDNSVIYQEEVFLQAYERKSIYIYLPYLDEGTHTITVGNVTLRLKVEKSIEEKLPTDLVLKYAKDLKFSESKGVVYKGFQISEGNFILVLSSLIAVTLILLFLGIYSTTVKSMKTGNVGILRAIGASNRQIFLFFINDAWRYVLIPVFLGILGGYLLILWIDSMSILTAFGHTLIIVPTWKDIITVIILSVGFALASMLIIFRNLMSRRVVSIMGREENLRIYTLEEIISGGNEAS